SRSPLFQVLVEMVDHNLTDEGTAEPMAGVTITGIPSGNTISRFDLNFSFRYADTLTVLIEYNTDLFEAGRIGRMHAHLTNLLAAVLADADAPLAALEYLPREERQALLSGPRPETGSADAVHGWVNAFEAQAQQHPDAVAVVYQGQEYTYRALNEASNRLAHHLADRYGIRPGAIVGLLVDRSERMIVALLGILKAGAAFLPLDPAYPKAWTGAVLHDAGVGLLLTDSDYLFDLPQGYQGQLMALDVELAGLVAPAVNPPCRHDPAALAYVIYTSGSTGNPKGVAVSLQSLENYVCWANCHYFDNQGGNRFALFTVISFDLTLTAIFSTLLRGDALVVCGNGEAKDLVRSVFAGDGGINTVKITPSHVTLLEHLDLAETPVKLVIVGGEELKWNHVEVLRRLNPAIRIFNEYGPTEATVGCLVKEVQDKSAIQSVGRAIWNTQVLILDKHGNLMPVGVEGEIGIAGTCLAAGYLNQPELTAEKFGGTSPAGGAGGRVYRSGDAGVHLASGEIAYTGRKDEQVKLRGHRVELGAIEAVLLGFPGVKTAKVIVAGHGKQNQYLVAYYLGAHVNKSSLRTHLYQNLPHYMVPPSLVLLTDLPLTVNGKVDVAALRLPDGPDDAQAFVAPGSATESRLAAIWNEVLGKDKIGIHDNFFTLGGNSLNAIRVISLLQKDPGVTVDLRDIFNLSRLEDLAAWIALKKKTDGTAGIAAIEEQDYYNVSNAQLRLWVLGQFGQNQIAYNIANACRITGKLNLPAFNQAFKELVNRHESLRTSFVVVDGEPRQKTHEAASFDFAVEYQDCRSDPDRENRVKALALLATNTPVDLAKAPLLRVKLFHLEEESYVFVFITHHILSDARSSEVLFREVFAHYRFYSSHTGGQPKTAGIQYKDYVAWQQQQMAAENLSRQKQYWQERFTGELPVIELPLDQPRPPVISFEGDKYRFSIGSAETALLRKVAKGENATLFMALLAGFNAFLAKLSGQEDIVVGTPVLGRKHPDGENLIGLFINTLALRNFPGGHKSFRTLLGEVKECVIEAYENQDYQFDHLVDDLAPGRDTGRNPLFDVVFVFEGAAPGERAFDEEALGFRVLPYGLKSDTSKFDLTLFAVETAGAIDFTFEYRTRLFRKETIAGFAGHFKTLLGLLLSTPDAPVAGLPLLSAADLALQHGFNQVPRGNARHSTIPAEFAVQVRNNPSQTALVFGDQCITYGCLDDRSDALATLLLAQGLHQEDIVGVLMERSPEVIIAMLAILKAGGAYLPLDASLPRQRLRYMLEDCNASLLLTTGSIASGLSFRGSVINLDQADLHLKGAPPVHRQEAHHLAYVMYTSGTSGTPKGVMIEHRSVLRLVQQPNYVRFSPADRLLATGALGFDATTFECWGMLLNGGQLHILPQHRLLDTPGLSQYVKQAR
ncbi:MAG: amino acid adenylation domain-containing protein, partial [Cytophagales bacterium]|nr:amino acid adenylation domain-containing protein [Cytophagales bacterium]